MKESGFSLIELMVVLSIISLLSCFAYPAYSRYWMQLKRLEARLMLLEGRIQLEKYAASSYRGYKGAGVQDLTLAHSSQNKWYTLALEGVNETEYTLIAKPIFKDLSCSELSCNAKNERFYKGQGSYHDCWGD